AHRGAVTCRTCVRSPAAVRRQCTLRKSPAVFRPRLHGDDTKALSHGDPLFKVHYVGTEKIFSLDLEQAEAAITRMLERSPVSAQLGKEHALVVRPRYVEVKEISTGRQLTKTYLRDIAYCAAHSQRPNVFLFICKQHGQQLHCRVFWCRRPQRAKDLTACLARSFQRALSDWQEGSAHHAEGESDRLRPPIPNIRKGEFIHNCTTEGVPQPPERDAEEDEYQRLRDQDHQTTSCSCPSSAALEFPEHHSGVHILLTLCPFKDITIV
uniref:PID domain-containing protein n=1 Tax=Denticeps clupeoides TaxID=299321 RepID=A0AAY4EFW8_9TELE